VIRVTKDLFQRPKRSLSTLLTERNLFVLHVRIRITLVVVHLRTTTLEVFLHLRLLLLANHALAVETNLITDLELHSYKDHLAHFINLVSNALNAKVAFLTTRSSLSTMLPAVPNARTKILLAVQSLVVVHHLVAEENLTVTAAINRSPLQNILKRMVKIIVLIVIHLRPEIIVLDVASSSVDR
jgi:hypothetical protein